MSSNGNKVNIDVPNVGDDSSLFRLIHKGEDQNSFTFSLESYYDSGILSDDTIKYLVEEGEMEISPFVPHQVKTNEGKKVISYGLSSYGYDIRVADEFKIFTNVNSSVVDPKAFDEMSFVDHRGEYCLIPPNSFVLARSVERIRLPRDVIVLCLGKSTLARVGLNVLVTPLEPEWEGYITLEFANTTPLPIKLYANEGCAQLVFLRGNKPCEVSYKDRGGKYMDQPPEIVTPRLKD